MKLFVSCAPGLELLLIDELMELGFLNFTKGFCGVYLDVDGIQDVYKINYCSRLASRVLLPLKKFRCYDQKALYRGASEIPWTSYLKRGQTFAIDANVHHRNLRNSLFCAQVVKDALCDQMRQKTGSRPNIEVKTPDVQINLFIHDEHAVISFDTSGDPLHKRGYRQEVGEAPLQESLAAALLRIARFHEDESLLDPCCGSGTLLIEAALIASHTAPGYLRRKWGFFGLPEFDQEKWLQVKNELDEQRRPLKDKQFYGCEIDADVARICRANVRAAGFLDATEILRIDFADYEPSNTPQLLITNPPHGRRLMGDRAPLFALYRRLGDFMKRKIAKPGRGFVFVGDLALAKEIGLAAKRRHVLSNSGIDSRLLEFDLY